MKQAARTQTTGVTPASGPMCESLCCDIQRFSSVWF